MKKQAEYICPGCLFSKKNRNIIFNNVFICNECKHSYIKEADPKKKEFFKTFSIHNKKGFRCPDCKRFIPAALNNSNKVFCPYLDCCFVGNTSSLNKMHHPTLNSKKLILDADNNSTFKANIVVHTNHSLNEEYLSKQKNKLKDIIDTQSNAVAYSNYSYTAKFKLIIYQAFSNLLNRFPLEMVSYLCAGSRKGGFQSLLFQEFIFLLEKELPFQYIKGGKVYSVESLLDPNINIFDGISTFESIINSKLEIKNNTKEFYIGGRKASYAKPYYIGKLLGINTKDNISLINNVVKYSFLKIKLRDVSIGDKVIVSHLRIPPHYELCGMSYINRIRKNIVDSL